MGWNGSITYEQSEMGVKISYEKSNGYKVRQTNPHNVTRRSYLWVHIGDVLSLLGVVAIVDLGCSVVVLSDDFAE